MMPTLADFTGTKASEKTDGISFLPALLSKSKQKQHEFLFWEFHEGGGKMAVRKGNWKGVKLNIAHPDKQRFELYDLSKDLQEKENIADKHPKIVEEMNRIMDESHTPSPLWNFGIEKK